MMDDPNTPSYRSWSPSKHQRVDRVCAQFEADLNAGRSPKIEDFLVLVPEADRSALKRELLAVEAEHAVRAAPGSSEEEQSLTETAASQPAESESRGPAPDCPVRPNQIGRYRIVKTLGEGGFGTVYLAHDEELKRPVAIKVPQKRRISSPQDVERYIAEARVVASLDHPEIVPVYDVGRTDDGLCYVVSKFIEGTDLRKRTKHSRPSHHESAGLVAKVAEALHYAHLRGLVHRDIKPANILVDAADSPYLADFGLALKDEDFGKGPTHAGTLPYMSPEQARGEGHRVDGRSDIFGLGVVFYELLTGRRPFRGEGSTEICQQITSVEARPPRQVDDTIPKELERICLKALAKRAVDRYTTAKDLAEDLRHFLKRATPTGPAPMPAVAASPDAETPPAMGATPAVPEAHTAPGAQPTAKIVPKGLRSFDAGDADFFLQLLPGPRDRDGLPESIRFWKGRIEEMDPDRTFAVGLIYGPSGCGKSSFVKAGLLPRLAGHVVSVYVEATGEETEARLLRGLRRHCPDLPDDLNLKECIATIRRGQGVAAGKKVLIVLDQFEQWLHANRKEADGGLFQAIRQCDAQRVQCVVLVRDDFWMAVTRFMGELEIPLLEGQNSAAIDLFDLQHAKRVLTAFGQAYGALPVTPDERTKEQALFLHQTVSGLAREGNVICVRLALFAEMMKGKRWVPGTLRAVGGPEGLGVTFLEETFSAATAPPEHRLHQKAARSVLKALLPEYGTAIRGNMRSHQQLLEVSGYARRPKDFEQLLAILDRELRLVTPTDPEGLESEGDPQPAAVAKGKYYQLTHDYLVRALRDWLTRKQKETIRGRAELRLGERAALWDAKPETRHLPAWWEFLNIRLFARVSSWTEPQRRMMKRAAHYHGVRTGALVVMLMLTLWGGIEVFGRLKARALVQNLTTAETADVPKIVDELPSHYRWATSLLQEVLEESPADSKERLHTSLALLPVDPKQVDYLYTRLLDAEADQFAVVRDALSDHKDALSERLWRVSLDKRQDESRRLRAACALATYAPDNRRWITIRADVAIWLVRQETLDIRSWAEALQPVSLRLRDPLSAIFRHSSASESERLLAAAILADYFAAEPRVLANLLGDADERSFHVLFRKLRFHGSTAVTHLAEQLARSRAEGSMNAEKAWLARRQAALAAAAKLRTERADRVWPRLKHIADQTASAEKARLARRQATLAVAMLRMGRADRVWSLLKHSPDPTVRSYLIDELAALGADPKLLVGRLAVEKDVSVRRALILALGEFGQKKLSPLQRDQFFAILSHWYRKDPDAGIHGACRWVLRRWGKQETLKRLDKELASAPEAEDRRWYVTGEGNTMCIVAAPARLPMKSPRSELRRSGSEGLHARRIEGSYAIASEEMTVEQFRRFLKANPRIDFRKHTATSEYSTPPDGPQICVSWYLVPQITIEGT